MQIGRDALPCRLSIADGVVSVTRADGQAQWSGWQISGVRREEYTIEVIVRDQKSARLQRFGRRTDEVEEALRRARADSLVRLMAPAGLAWLEAMRCNGAGGLPGYLYRYEDGLRRVPDGGPGFVRLYGELDGAAVDLESYSLTLTGPFGADTLSGLARRTRDLAVEVGQRVERARETLAQRLTEAGLPWEDDLEGGLIRAHVPFEATGDRLEAIEAAGLVVPERVDYWAALRRDGLVGRLVISADAEGAVRLVALCSLNEGELYEVLTEADHASYVFRAADPVLRAWTEVGFRREPIFADTDLVEELPALLEVAPSLRAAREGLLRRVVHDNLDGWRRSLG